MRRYMIKITFGFVMLAATGLSLFVHIDSAQASGAVSELEVAPGLTLRTERLKLILGSPPLFQPVSTKDGNRGPGAFDLATYVLRVDLANPHITPRFVTPLKRVVDQETVSAIAKRYDGREGRVLAAVNSSMTYRGGMPAGLLVMDGEVMSSSPGPLTTVLALFADGTARIDTGTAIQGSLRITGARDGAAVLVIDGVNKKRTAKLNNHAFITTDRMGSVTGSEGSGVEVTVAPAAPGDRLRPGQVLKGTVQFAGNGNNSRIPLGGIVVTASGDKADWLRSNVKSGDEVELLLDYGPDFNDAVYAIGIDAQGTFSHNHEKPILLGGDIPAELTSFNDPTNWERHPRTIFGLAGNELFLIAIDGRQAGYSDGVTLLEAAYYVQSLGVEDAINVDGGGSVTLILRDADTDELHVVNRPSEGYERPGHGSALLIFAE